MGRLPIGQKAAQLLSITGSHRHLAVQFAAEIAPLLAAILRASRMLAHRQAGAGKLNPFGGAFMRFELIFLHDIFSQRGAWRPERSAYSSQREYPRNMPRAPKEYTIERHRSAIET